MKKTQRKRMYDHTACPLSSELVCCHGCFNDIQAKKETSFLKEVQKANPDRKYVALPAIDRKQIKKTENFRKNKTATCASQFLLASWNTSGKRK
jgi:hypothetical protein